MEQVFALVKKGFETCLHLFFVLLSILVLGQSAQAQCKMSLDVPAQFFASYETKTISRFGDTQTRLAPPTVVERCQGASGRYLMISLGLRSSRLSSEMADISFDGKLKDDQCRIENSLLSHPISYEERKQDFEDRFRFIRTCTYLKIWDVDKSPIDFPADQRHCKMKIDSKGIVSADGDFCFIAIRPSNRFAIGAVMRPECADKEFLKAHKLHPMDVDASLNVYTAGDATGSSVDLDALGSTRMRFVVTPDSKLLPLSDYVADDHPRFPSEWAPEVHMGTLRLQKTGETRTNIDLNMLVDTRTPRQCLDGICAGPGDFSIPVMGEVELYDISKSTKPKSRRSSFIDSWYFGGIAQANWQGLLKGTPHFIDSEMLKVGGQYEMTVTFVDPYDDYILFLNGLSQMSIDLKQLQGTAGLDVLKPLDSLTRFTALPVFSGLPSINDGDIPASMEKFLAVLKRLGGDRDWPVYYDKFCDRTLKSCVHPNKTKWFLKLTTQFSISSQKLNNEFEVSDVKLLRQSTHDSVLSYQKRTPELPRVTCDARSR